MSKKLAERIRGSASWAAYGDALGFITELTNRKGLRRRTGGDHVNATVAWKRRIGGRGGPTVELPAGTISDDTQLRLATSRSIRGNGDFDVELFSKVELTTFPAYALGAGRGTLAASASLKKRNTSWVSNFFDEGGVKYLQGGGNGAAMRIQPHAWHTSNDDSPARMVHQVVSNAVCTHGHARGIVGAVFHALCVRSSIRDDVPDPGALIRIAAQLGDIEEAVRGDARLGAIWETQWERESRQPFAEGVERTAMEIVEGIELAASTSQREPATAYRNAIDVLDARNPKERGSGTKTAILGSFAAWLFRNEPDLGLQICSNELGTDTDSIATMAGAILGPGFGPGVPGAVADLDYVLFEADRMVALSEKRSPSSFPYPDLLRWTSPKTAADCVGYGDSGPHVSGLGPALPEKEEEVSGGQFEWQWLRLWYGQRILAKRRIAPRELEPSQQVNPLRSYLDPSAWTSHEPPRRDPERPGRASNRAPRDIRALAESIVASDFDPTVIGEAFLSLRGKKESSERSIALAAIIDWSLDRRDS